MEGSQGLLFGGYPRFCQLAMVTIDAPAARVGICAWDEVLNFSALLIPTMDSVRAEYILDIIAKHDVPVLEL